jgi:branched-subunit amino acid transport protein
VEITRLQIILIMGLMALAMRALPQLFFAGQQFPEAWERWLRYVSYGLICSIISVTLFVSGSSLETSAAPQRALALLVAVITARRTSSAVTGMLVGTLLTLLLGWAAL